MVGCGNMGACVKQALDPDHEITVLSPSQVKYRCVADLPNNYSPEMIILAVKPQIMAQVVDDYKTFSKAVIITMAAGIPIGFYEKHFPQQNVIRIMPNLPVKYSKGIVPYFSNNLNSFKNFDCQQFLDPLGFAFQVESEEMLNKVMVLAGSGPGFIWHLCSAWQNAAIKLGFSSTLAKELIMQLFNGASFYAVEEKKSFQELATAVASKGGVTEAGLEIMACNPLDTYFHNIFTAALNRATDMEKPYTEEA